MAHFLSLSLLCQIKRLTNPLFTPQEDLKSINHFQGWELQLSNEKQEYSIGTKNDLWQRTRITLEFPFSISKTRAAHHLAILSLTIPLLSNLVVHSIVMAPFWEVGKIRGKELLAFLTHTMLSERGHALEFSKPCIWKE